MGTKLLISVLILQLITGDQRVLQMKFPDFYMISLTYDGKIPQHFHYHSISLCSVEYKNIFNLERRQITKFPDFPKFLLNSLIFFLISITEIKSMTSPRIPCFP